MQNKKLIYLAFIIISGMLACSLSNVSQNAGSIKETAQALGTDVNGLVSSSGSLIQTARALGTDHPGIIGTVKAIGTQGAPLLSTIQAVSTNNPSLLETAKALVDSGLPTGEPPPDIPIIDKDVATNFLGGEKYIIYSTPNEYSYVLDFFKTEMQASGWQLVQDDSHEYAKAAQLNYYKDSRTATVNLSRNPLNDTTVVVINIANN
jgi:hypothetical protein